MNKLRRTNGEVSLFVVIFSAMLITIVTVGFTGVMMKSQQQASNIDLSQSAYDSAQAGVEDAKRALLRYQSICTSGSSAECDAAASNINSTLCNVAVDALVDVDASGGEVPVKTGESNNLNQAYTCVKINLETEDYLGVLSRDTSNLIPLRGVGDFSKIRIEWFNSDDLGVSNNTLNLDNITTTPLKDQNSWPATRPPIVRAQLIQFGSEGFVLDDFDGANTNTVFLYPKKSPQPTTISGFAVDTRRQPTDVPYSVQCKDDLSTGGYACSVTLTLPDPINGGDRVAFLNLAAIYNSANYRITLLGDGDEPVMFNGVQPSVDSTGRANDLFRRVQSRVELTSIFPYPNAAVDIVGNLCKDFMVTDDRVDYRNNCTP